MFASAIAPPPFVEHHRHADRRPVLRAAAELDVGRARAAVLADPDRREDLLRPDGGREHALEELGGRDEPLGAGADDEHLRVEREQARGQVGGRVAVGDRAADRAAVTHLRVADLGRRGREQRRLLAHERVGREVVVARERADRERVAVVADVAQLREPPHVDEQRRAARP